MVAQELLSGDIPPLSVEQTGKDAFHMLGEYHVKHLPVVDEGKLIGIISEEDIFNNGLYATLKTYSFEMLRHFSVKPEEHIFKIIRIMGENRLTVVPVSDNEKNYLGLISQNDLLSYFSQTNSFAAPGAILVLAMQKNDYSLGTLAQIAEQEGLHVLSSVISSSPQDEVLEVTLKFSSMDIAPAAASYERRGYTIRHAYTESDYQENLRQRYNALMRYLDI